MERTAVTSKILHSIAYDGAAKVLEVEFLRKKDEGPRKVYRYLDVPAEKWEAMRKAKSMGSYFLVFIKPNHKFARVEEDIESTKKAPAATPSAPSTQEASSLEGIEDLEDTQ